MKKISLLLLFVLLISGCSKSLDTMTDNLSQVIVDSNQVKNPSLSGLNKEEKSLLEDFFEMQKKDNKVISIDNSVYFSEESYTEEENTSAVYEKDGKYYINYKDIKWEKTPNGDDYYAIINLNGYQSALYKSLVPILYDETNGNSKYNYEFGKKVKTQNKVKYYYKSIYDDSGFVIEFSYDNDKITSIDTYYQDIYYVVE